MLVKFQKRTEQEAAEILVTLLEGPLPLHGGTPNRYEGRRLAVRRGWVEKVDGELRITRDGTAWAKTFKALFGVKEKIQ